jgi:predicted methyltransferase
MIRTTVSLVVFVLLGVATFAQDQSVKPGINKSFENAKVPEFVERFEKEGRDVYDNRKKIVDACDIKPGTILADVGSGTGLFTRMFSPLVGSGGKVYAVDITESFVRHVEESAKQEKLTNIVGVVCKADSVELPPASIDLAFICDTYHHFEYPQKTMRSIHKALKPGGQVILIDFRRIEGESKEWTLDHVRAGQDVFTREVVGAGFRQIDEKQDLLKESYFVRFRKVD